MSWLKNFREVAKRLKRRNITPKFCPKCGNPNLQLSGGIQSHPKWYGFTPMQYVCEKCGYKGPIAMEKEDETEKEPKPSEIRKSKMIR